MTLDSRQIRAGIDARLAEQTADPADVRDYEREQALRAIAQQRGSLTQDERDELAELRARSNERARERFKAERDAAKAAEQQRHAEARAQAAAAERGALVAQLRAGGLSAPAAEREADRVLADRVAERGDALLAAKRRQFAGF